VFLFLGGIKSSAKSERLEIKEYVGELKCTTYHVSDNTPAGSRATSTGARATEWHTIAVDYRNPRFPIGTKLYVEGFGYGIVEDVGGFDKYGVSLDLFTPESVGFKEDRKVWVCREETDEEYEERMTERRKRVQKGSFTLMYDPSLLPWQVKTHKEAIKGGTIRFVEELGMFDNSWLEVVKTLEGDDTVIYTGDLHRVIQDSNVYLEDVFENAVG
jgi:3D (Asp-Asp-Asp) domain-containing protein